MFASVKGADARRARRHEIESELRSLRATINAVTARFAALVGEHSEADFHHEHAGISSPAEFLSWQTGLTPSAARQMVILARALGDLPELRAAFEAGTLGFEQARLVASIAHPSTESELVTMALGMSGAQLARFVSLYRGALEDQRPAAERRSLRGTYRTDGTYRLSATVTADEGAIFERALGTALKELREVHGNEPDPEAADPWAAERADALVLVAEKALSAHAPADGSPVKHEIVIHADVGAFRTGGESTRARIENGGPISPEALGRLACGAAFVPLLEDGGEPLAIGRARRSTTTAIERALKARDEHCVFPGCCRSVYTEAHHVQPWNGEGPTDLDNLALLCWKHHREVHRRGLRMERTSSGYTFRHPDGRKIENAVPLPRMDGGWSGAIPGDREVDDQTCFPDWAGERGDIRYVADIYLVAFGELGLPDRRAGPRLN